MDAVSATIVDGEQGILLKTQRLIEKKISFILRVTTVFFWLRPQPAPWTGPPRIGLCRYIKSTPVEGQTAPPPWLRYLLHFLWAVVDGLMTSQAHCM
jgi:hypothetical protein